MGLVLTATAFGVLAIGLGAGALRGGSPASAHRDEARIVSEAETPPGVSPTKASALPPSRTVPKGAAPPEGAVPSSATGADSLPAAGASSARFVMPLKAWTAVTDRFGAPRGEGLVHGGIDLALNDQPQSQVYAACDGVLLNSANSATYGNYVVVDCADGWTTLYADRKSTRLNSSHSS